MFPQWHLPLINMAFAPQNHFASPSRSAATEVGVTGLPAFPRLNRSLDNSKERCGSGDASLRHRAYRFGLRIRSLRRRCFHS